MKRAEFLATIDIGTTIKRLREMKGLSQEQLAKDICDRTNITKLENGHSKVPSLSFVLAICERLGMSMDEFLNYASTNNYKLDKKHILDLLMNNDMNGLKKYINNLNSDYLSAIDLRYYKFLLAKIELSLNNLIDGKKILKELIKSGQDDYVYTLAMHELLKFDLIKRNSYTENIYTRKFLNKLREKQSNEQYLYYINDLLQDNMDKENIEISKYLLELEIAFINSHDLYKYLSNYYQNKIEVYKDEYTNIQDIERKLFSIKNKQVTN